MYLKKKVVVLIQSYQNLQVVYHLINSGHNFLICTSNHSVYKFCILMGWEVYGLNFIKLKIKFFNITILRIFFSFLHFYIFRRYLHKISNKEPVSYLITILGMDYELLPAFLNLEREVFFWDDSWYAKHKIVKNVTLKKLIKLKLYNFLFSTNFKYIKEETFDYIMMHDVNDLKSSIKIIKYKSINKTIPQHVLKKFSNNKYPIIILGDYSFFSISRKINIGKFIILIKKLFKDFPGSVFYKPHPGSTSCFYSTKLFGKNLISDFIPAEILCSTGSIILTVGSATSASLSVKNSRKIIGIGKLVDLRKNLFPMSIRQGLKHVNDYNDLLDKIKRFI